jgi:Pyruvate/2-oxoacid:ferredoxin oxidoreductase gamma subunit
LDSPDVVLLLHEVDVILHQKSLTKHQNTTIAGNSERGSDRMQGQLKEADELNSKLAALRKRQTALKQAIEFEMVREQKRRERESHRLSLIVGTVMVNPRISGEC